MGKVPDLWCIFLTLKIWNVDTRGRLSTRYMLKLSGPPAMLKQMGRRQLAWRFPNRSICYVNHSRSCAVAAVLDYLCDGPCPSFRLTAPGVPINCFLQSSLPGCHLPGQAPLVPLPKLRNWSSRIGWLHLQQRRWRYERRPSGFGSWGRAGAPSMCCSHSS